MAKIKKTRKDKMLADQRRQEYMSTRNISYTLTHKDGSSSSGTSVSKDNAGELQNNQRTIVTDSYLYLRKDLQRTMLVTTAIVVIQIVLYFFVIK